LKRSVSRRVQLLVCILAVMIGAAAALLQPRPLHAPSLITVPAVRTAAPKDAEPAKPKILDKGRVLKAAPAVLSALKTPVGPMESPAFVEVRDGIYDVKTAHYQARLTAAEGLQYHPIMKSGKSAEVQVRLRSVTRGANVVFDRATDAEAATEDAVEDGNGAISFWRAPGFEERYKPRGDGVEQNFSFDSAVAGSGALEFVCDLTSKNLSAQAPRPNRAGGISFLEAGGKEFALIPCLNEHPLWVEALQRMIEPFRTESTTTNGTRTASRLETEARVGKS